jgi:Aldo/keto reductase family
MSGIYGKESDDESIATIHEAIDRGINVIDTGDFYGMGHRAPLSQPHLMERDEPRWTLPRLGTAGSSGCRTQKRIPPCAGQFRRRGTNDDSPPSRAQLDHVLRIMQLDRVTRSDRADISFVPWQMRSRLSESLSRAVQSRGKRCNYGRRDRLVAGRSASALTDVQQCRKYSGLL